jgi:hypothetical protein
MSGPGLHRWQRIPFVRLATPRGFLKAAALITAAFTIGHLAGLREYTSFFSGTMAGGEPGYLPLLLGFAYAVAWFAFVVLAPILALAAGIQAGLLRAVNGARRRAPTPGGPPTRPPGGGTPGPDHTGAGPPAPETIAEGGNP